MRIYITGPAGSGKSTIAKQLWEYYSLPVTHLDTLLWKENWIENPDYKELQGEVLKKESWIIEWPSCSIIKSMDMVDAIIILNTGYIGNMGRILKRTLLHRFWKEKRIGIKITERWNMSLFLKTLTWRKRQLPRILKNIELHGLQEKTCVIHTSKNMFQEVQRFLG